MITLLMAMTLWQPIEATPAPVALDPESLFLAMDLDADQLVTENEFTAYYGEDSGLSFTDIAGDDSVLTSEELREYMENHASADDDEVAPENDQD